MNRRTRIDEATISANLRFDTRRERKTGTYPVKLELYFKGAKVRYDLKTYFTREEWSRINSPKLKDEELKSRKNNIEKEKTKALEIIKDIKDNFSFEIFEKYFLNKQPKRDNKVGDVYSLFESQIQFLKKESRIGYAESLASTLKALRGKISDLKFTDITPAFLKDFEDYMLKNEKSITTVAIYLRNLRMIYNLAIEEGLAKKENYPFGALRKKKYEIPTAHNPKKALNEKTIKRIIEYNPLSEEQRMAKDFWLFSFMCNGMNFTDICHLKRADFKDNHFVFERKKTARRNRKIKIVVILNDFTRKVIKDWGGKNDESDFVFPFINENQSKEEQYREIRKLNRSLDYYLKSISKDLELDVSLGLMYARHSYCTYLRDMGVPIPEISENVGHTLVSTTANYLAQFSVERKEQTANLLTKFLTDDKSRQSI